MMELRVHNRKGLEIRKIRVVQLMMSLLGKVTKKFIMTAIVVHHSCRGGARLRPCKKFTAAGAQGGTWEGKSLPFSAVN